MVEILDFNPGEIEIPFYLNEGRLTVEKDTEIAGGTDTSWILEKKIHKGDKVVLDTGSDRTVKKAVGGETELIGEIIDTPGWEGTRPSETSEYGDYKPRVATVRVYGAYINTVDIKKGSTAVNVGDSVKPSDNPGEFIKSTKNSTRCLNQVSGEGKAYIVYGFYGEFS